ncbi:MAG: arsenate reductase ArsC [Woeseiaceae bacterium]|nr:arsenate reductase ArsC [Woeseiaceae bacterium]
MHDKTRVLFLCTGNSCRSQMAEGFARHFWGERFDVCSAGIEKHGLNPLAVKAMQEIGIDISAHQSKMLDELPNLEPDVVITVCGHADETCPAFPGTVKRLHVGFDDPPKLAANARSEQEAMQHYRRVRDEIATFSKDLPAKIQANGDKG